MEILYILMFLLPITYGTLGDKSHITSLTSDIAENNEVVIGNDVTLTCIVGSSLPVNITWSRTERKHHLKVESSENGQLEFTYTIQQVTIYDSDVYNCTVDNGIDIPITKSVPVYVIPVDATGITFSGGQIAGLVIGFLIIILLIVGMVCAYQIRKKTNRKDCAGYIPTTRAEPSF